MKLNDFIEYLKDFEADTLMDNPDVIFRYKDNISEIFYVTDSESINSLEIVMEDEK